VVAVAVGGALSGSAAASSVGCTSAGGDPGFDQVCLEIKGEGLHVDSFKVGLSDYDLKGPAWVPAPICNYYATVTIDPPGPDAPTVLASSKHEGCSYGYAWFDFPGGTFPHRTKVCGRFFVDDRQRGGAPCNRVLK
jgi:hypothetical protein